MTLWSTAARYEMWMSGSAKDIGFSSSEKIVLVAGLHLHANSETAVKLSLQHNATWPL